MKLMIKAGELWSAKSVLDKICGTDMDIRPAWMLFKRTVEPFMEAWQEIDRKRQELVKQYGENGKTGIEVPDAKRKDFHDDFNRLLNEEVALDFEPISINTLPGVKVSVNDLAMLGKLVAEPVAPVSNVAPTNTVKVAPT